MATKSSNPEFREGTGAIFHPVELVVRGNGDAGVACELVATDFPSPEKLVESMQEHGIDASIEAPIKGSSNRSSISMSGLGDKYEEIFGHSGWRNN